MNRLVTEEEMQMVKKHEKMYNLTFQVDNINKMVSKVWGNEKAQVHLERNIKFGDNVSICRKT